MSHSPCPSHVTKGPMYSLTAISCTSSGPGTKSHSHCPQGAHSFRRQTLNPRLCLVRYVPRHGMGKAGQGALGTQTKGVLIQESFLEEVGLISVWISKH